MQVTVFLSQLFLRLFLLGLSVRVGEQRQNVVAHKTKALVRELQVELVVNDGAPFSALMVQELEVLAGEFACLEFYEGLREVFAKCDTFHVQEWITKAMAQRREQFEEQSKALAVPKQDEMAKQPAKKITKKRVTINVTNFPSNEKPLEAGQSTAKLAQ
jgi:hypothetical protein